MAETNQDGEGVGEVTFGELESDTSLLPEGEEGDSFAISYDNAGVDDAGSSVTQTYSGGQLALTLTGTTDYRATKIWLDNGDASGRPQAEFALWRYIVGQPAQPGFSGAALRCGGGRRQHLCGDDPPHK